MKKIVLLAALISTVAFGNNADIPEVIASAFSSEFPAAEDVNWKKEFSLYKADFILKNKPMTALFNHAGECVETATYIDEKELPQKALKEIDWYYNNWQIVSSRKARDSNSDHFYRVTVETGEAFYFLKVDEEGDIIDTSVRHLSQKTDKK
ncbi:MAG: hypothetical protein PVF73_09405 [Bacteroidales bacterium]|jgi:hypothetical protein